MSVPSALPPLGITSRDHSIENSLVNHLRSLDIGVADTHQYDLDVYVTQDTINRAFEALAAEFPKVQNAYRVETSVEYIPAMWRSMKIEMVNALCGPYRKAISMRSEENTLKDSEISQLHQDNTAKDSEISQLHQDNTAKDSEISRLRQKNTTKKSEILRLHQETNTKDTEISRLRQENIEISRLRQDNTTKDSEIIRLRQENDSNSSEILRLRQEVLSLATEHSSKILKDVEKIGGLKVRVDQLQRSTDYYSGEVVRLTKENLQMRSQKIYPNGVPATGTRTQTWEAVLIDRNNSMDNALPFVENLISDDELNNLAVTKYVKESGMYTRIRECFNKHLKTPMSDDHPGSQVFDTHHSELISGLKPDISIVTASRTTATASCLIAVVELKAGRLTKDAFGQLYDYLKGIQKLQPNRRLIVGLLSNLEENRFVMLDTGPSRRTRCIRYNSVSLRIAMTYLRDVIITDSICHPPASVFVPSLGPMEEQLGNPAFSILGVFKIPPRIKTTEFREGRWVIPWDEIPDGDQMVVKRTTPGVHGSIYQSRAPRTVVNEIEILLKIRVHTKNEELTRRNILPDILYHTLDYQEFGIVPRGTPIHASDGHTNWAKVLVDVLDALRWLHNHQIIHRDVRIDNIIWVVDHAVLIDLGTAVDMSSGDMVNFNGGYICCPPRLLGDLSGIYEPIPADDCLAVVMLVNTILFPSRWECFQSAELEKPGSPETRSMEQFWKRMATSAIWGPFYEAGRNAKYDILRMMDQFFVHMSSAVVA